MKYKVQKEGLFWYGYEWREYKIKTGGYWWYIMNSISFSKRSCMKKLKRYHENRDCTARKIEEFEL